MELLAFYITIGSAGNLSTLQDGCQKGWKIKCGEIIMGWVLTTVLGYGGGLVYSHFLRKRSGNQ
jgi:hypothetical protein